MGGKHLSWESRRVSDIADTELMLRAGTTNDESAFSVLVQRYSNVLLNFFLRKGVSFSDGEDLAQRTFLRLWRYRARYSPQAKFTTFLFMLANQEVIDFFRSAKRRKDMENGFETEQKVEADVVRQDRDGVDDEGIAVRRAVAGLSDSLRDVVELGIFQELPYAEIAEILGIPQGTVKSRMFNALRKLKEVLDNGQRH